MRHTVSTASIFFALLIISIQSRTNPRHCSRSCGDIHNVEHPFRLRGELANCGDPDYELYCDNNNQTILNYHAGLYYVKSISYGAERVIRLVDVNLAAGTCRLPYRSLANEEIVSDGRYDIEYSHPYATFVRCSNETDGLSSNSSLVPCLSGNTTRVYVNYTNYMLTSYEIPSNCRIVSRVLYDDKARVPSDYEDIRRTLQLGFDLKWTPECRDCKIDGGECRFPGPQSNRFQCNIQDDLATQIRIAILVLSPVPVVGLVLFARWILAPLIIFGFLLNKCLSRRKWIDQQTPQSLDSKKKEKN